MVDFVWAVHEVGLRSVDCDLDFAVDEIVELGVDHDVLGPCFESVLDSDDFEYVGVFADSLKLLKNCEYFGFIWVVLASEQVWNMESYQIQGLIIINLMLSRPFLN